MILHNPPAAATGARARLRTGAVCAPANWKTAKMIWTRNSPAWTFDDATLQRAAVAFDNPGYVDVVLHSYRHRLGSAPSHPPYTGD
jgi:hypothetical protein